MLCCVPEERRATLIARRGRRSRVAGQLHINLMSSSRGRARLHFSISKQELVILRSLRSLRISSFTGMSGL